MVKRIQQLLAAVAVGYISLYFVSAQLANFTLAVFLVLLIPFLILRWLFINHMYKYSIQMVSKSFVLGPNALHNEHCTVIYTPDEKIVVMDNIPDKKRAKRMFTLTKDKLNVNKAWNRVCRVFDSFISLDSLAAFYSYDTKIDIVTLEAKIPSPVQKKEITIDVSNQGPKFVDMNQIQVDPYSKGTGEANDAGASFVNIDNIQEQKPVVEREQSAPEFKDLGDILSNSTNKIDVNFATASELSILPGINIVMAKKIVEHRDMNGLFNSDDEFLQIANVKEHFIPKIKSMIILGKPSDKNNDNNDFDEGRIVDF